jgi:acetyl esterase/lipase
MEKHAEPSAARPDHVVVINCQIPVRDGAEVPVRIYPSAKTGAEGSPLIVHYHGGGFALGDLEGGTELG